MKLSWNGSGQKIYGNIIMRWISMSPDFIYYELWSKSKGAWNIILELMIRNDGSKIKP